jgi:hypothetical protein
MVEPFLMVEPRFEPVFLEVGRDRRITIPAAYADQVDWLAHESEKKLLAWLLMIASGRFRLLPDSTVEHDPKLGRLRSIIIAGPAEPEVEATVYESNERAAAIGRLMPVPLSGPHPSWRMVVPKHGVPDSEQYRFVLLFSLGYLELWLLDVYTAAVKAPLDLAI